MAYRFKARSTTPGEYRLAANTLSQLIALGDIQESVGRGDGGVGTFVVPGVGDVVDGVFYGAGGTEFEGTYAGGGGYTYGDNNAAYVLTTATGAGTYVVPVVGQVLAPSQGGTAYGPSSGTSGTLTLANTQYVLSSAPDYGIAGTGGAKTATLPTAGNVLTGSGAFGVNGTSVTPSYSPDFPAVGSVTTDDTVNGSAGTFVIPAVADVAVGVGYGEGGTEYTGELTGGGTFPAEVSFEGDIYTT